jgi:hypothetical protein
VRPVLRRAGQDPPVGRVGHLQRVRLHLAVGVAADEVLVVDAELAISIQRRVRVLVSRRSTPGSPRPPAGTPAPGTRVIKIPPRRLARTRSPSGGYAQCVLSARTGC